MGSAEIEELIAEMSIAPIESNKLGDVAEICNALSVLMVATFDLDGDLFHPVQTFTVSTDGTRLIIWLQPNQPLDHDWQPMPLGNHVMVRRDDLDEAVAHLDAETSPESRERLSDALSAAEQED